MTRTDRLTLRRPDDWHLHLRDGATMQAVLPHTAAHFGRAIIMPNLVPPVTDPEAAAAYRDRILAALPPGTTFEPLMTCYLTDATEPDRLEDGFARGLFTAAKLYPAGATTNSESGVTDIARIARVLERMQTIGMRLLVHGEVVDPDIDIFDREAVFIDRVLSPTLRDFPSLRVVFEHVTTAEAVDFVRSRPRNLAATVTPHHLLINRNALFEGGLRPHAYCLPVAKREKHRLALRRAATSGDERFFLGTDSAPHPIRAKEADCGCAGIFNAPTALAAYAQVFDEEGALDRLEGFASLHGPAFYGLEPNAGTITLERVAETALEAVTIDGGADAVRVFRGGEVLAWRVVG
ncbi:MAG: dihydroorotase [Inquilinaceae bacterium]